MSPKLQENPDFHAERETRNGSKKGETLRRLHNLPPEAKFTPEETSIYLNVRRDLLRAWRWQGRGPPFEGQGHFMGIPRGIGTASWPARPVSRCSLLTGCR